MPKSRNRKDHKKKLAQRKQKMAQDKARYEKAKREFIMDLIKKEQEKGMFENNPTITPSIDGPAIDTTIEGPSI